MDEIVKAIAEESKPLIKPVYDDLVQPAAREIGTALGRTVHTYCFLFGDFVGGMRNLNKLY